MPSDITLLDDSFASIATAVMWGRSLYRNIQRFVLFQLTINFAAILICFVGAVFGTDMPLTVVQILWVNIIMDTFAAMAMASLPPNPEVMLEKPRPRNEFIITRARRARFHVRHYHGRGIAGHAVLVDDHDRRADRAPADGLLLDVRIPAILEYVQRKDFRTRHSSFPACAVP